ncbi:hypothetical protein [Bacillus ndiopicus]|uniref:hypothetical protein n=1 Tax=Bacillus ndiopicus TaxID=1347368 RepID=UPI0005A9A53E|nr:hypothetical protein [Bacillus ndiopicus]
MKKFFSLFLCVSLLAACSNTDETKIEPPSNNGGETNNTANQAKAQHADFQSAIPADWQVQLPTDFPIKKDTFLTAKTTVTEDKITYDFYQFDDEVELDAANVTDGYYIGQLTVTRYEDELKADDELLVQLTLHDDYIADIGPELIYPFTEGDESIVNWSSNGWNIFAYSREKSEQELVDWIKEKDLVNEISNGIENGYYPRPQIVGQMHFYADDETRNFATWAKKEIVFTLKDFNENTLDWLHVFNK